MLYINSIYIAFSQLLPLMKKENLKRIISNLESILNELKSEVYSDKESYVHPWDEHIRNAPRTIQSEDDDGYAD